MKPTTRTVEHVGEWRVAIESDSPEDLFAEVGRLIARSAGATRGPVGEWEAVEVRARDRATLLADWANELLGRSEAESRAFEDFRGLRLIPGEDGSVAVAAEIRGRMVDPWASPLKAATYHGLELTKHGPGWTASLLFDI